MTPVGNQYGQALYDLAADENLSERILPEITALQDSFVQNPDYIRLLSSPALSKQERCALLEEGFRDQVHPYVLNFMKLLTERGHMGHFGDCCRAFTRLYDRDHNILAVKAITAFPLSQDQRRRLAEKLQSVTGKTIRLENRVEADCLGGVRLEYDGKCLDDTLAHRLESVGKLLKETVI